MSQRFDEIHCLIEKLRSSRTNPTIVAPSNADLSRAIEVLGSVTEKKELYESLVKKMQQTPVVLSQEFADSFDLLLSDVSQLVANDPKKRRALEYQPNQIPFKERLNNFFFAFALLAYGLIAIRLDDFFIPGKRGKGVHLHGLPAWIMFCAVVCASIVLLLVIVDHYDRRDNERHYQTLTKLFRVVGWGLFGAAFVCDLGKHFGWFLL